MTGLSRFVINHPKVIHETIEGETVLVNLDSGTYYSLDGIGAEVWALVERGAPVGGIIEWVASRYEGTRVDIEKALFLLMEELQREALIVTDETRESGDLADYDGSGTVEAGLHTATFVPPVLHKYTDMQDLLLLDPIHDVDEAGWPSHKTESPRDEQ